MAGPRNSWYHISMPAAVMPAASMLTAVIPVLNEAESLATLCGELDRVAVANGYDLQIVFVDDGSTDGSWDEIQRLASSDSRAEGIRFRRNFGKAAALTAGFQAARGEIVLTLDADLQDDPAEIPRFLEHLEQGPWDVVSGYKQVRHDPWHKVLPSRVFNYLVSSLTGVKLHDHNCGFKCYRREVLGEVQLYGERHRFVPVLAAARGYTIGEIVVGHRARRYGKSKYGLSRLAKGFLDLLTVKFITGYGQRPQHLLGSLGLISFFFGLCGLTFIAGYWSVSRLFDAVEVYHLKDHMFVATYSLGALLFGGQLMSIGFLAEMMAAHHSHDRQAFSIRETTDESAS